MNGWRPPWKRRRFTALISRFERAGLQIDCPAVRNTGVRQINRFYASHQLFRLAEGEGARYAFEFQADRVETSHFNFPIAVTFCPEFSDIRT